MAIDGSEEFLAKAGASDDDIAGVLIAVSSAAGLPRVVAAAPHVAAALAA